MKTAHKRRKQTIRPKHKHTKEYLSHYYPFLPLMLSIGFLIISLFFPFGKNTIINANYNNKISDQSLLEQSNNQRKKHSKKSLSHNDKLASAAQAKASDMATRDYWSHNTPEGSEPWVFISNANYSYEKAGENLAYGFNTSKEIVSGWMNSKTHRDNLLDSEFSEVGFGLVSSKNYNNNGPATIVVAMYGKPSKQGYSMGKHAVLGTSTSIKNIGVITNNLWSYYLTILVVGASLTFLLLTNIKRIKKLFAKSEKYLLKHSLLDSLVISVVALSIFMLRSAGNIL